VDELFPHAEGLTGVGSPYRDVPLSDSEEVGRCSIFVLSNIPGSYGSLLKMLDVQMFSETNGIRHPP
jgi:hypothetical protein